MARLITSVHVADESGIGHVFGPSDAVPSWAAARITNPAAWDGPPPEPEVMEPVVVETETTTESETVTEEVAPETVSAPATEEELTPDLAAESVSEPETVEPEPETVTAEPEPVTAAPKRRGRPAKAATNN